MAISKTFKRAVSILGIVFATAAAIDLDGYNLFDREDGSNPLCEIDPTCRRLTSGEVAMAEKIFGDTVDYKPVKVFNRLPFLMPTPDATMRMWNKNIYAIMDEYKNIPDYSAINNEEVAGGFIHEVTHIWQYTTDPKFFISAAASLIQKELIYNDLYPYDLDAHKNFADYNFEQQARIVGNYYWHKAILERRTKGMILEDPAYFSRTFNRTTRNLCRKTDRYTELVSQVLPQEEVPQCAMYRPYEKPQVDPFAEDPQP